MVDVAICRSGSGSSGSAVDIAHERVLASLQRAKLGPPLSEQERADLAEVEADRGNWLTTEEMLAQLGEHPGRGTDEDDGE